MSSFSLNSRLWRWEDLLNWIPIYGNGSWKSFEETSKWVRNRIWNWVDKTLKEMVDFKCIDENREGMENWVAWWDEQRTTICKWHQLEALDFHVKRGRKKERKDEKGGEYFRERVNSLHLGWDCRLKFHREDDVIAGKKLEPLDKIITFYYFNIFQFFKKFFMLKKTFSTKPHPLLGGLEVHFI